MAAIADLAARLAAGGPVVIDGGTGTEIQRRGGAMDADTWCADANRTAPEVVLDVHRAYIDAGAELIIANTFATSPLLFDHLGRLDDLVELDDAAMDLARRAAAERVPVAGSISTMRPVVAGSDRNTPTSGWTGARARRLFAAKAANLARAGADLLVTEMMRDTDHARWATEAALATGLPVWVGVSVERNGAGELVGWGRPDCRADEVIGGLCALGPDLVAVMHTSVDDTADAIALVRAVYDGPIGVYPEVGHFTMPDWVFAEVSADELVARTGAWVAQGAALVGGCCGVTPDHIAALGHRFRRDT